MDSQICHKSAQPSGNASLWAVNGHHVTTPVSAME